MKEIESIHNEGKNSYKICSYRNRKPKISPI